jgi:hypothetical protein
MSCAICAKPRSADHSTLCNVCRSLQLVVQLYILQTNGRESNVIDKFNNYLAWATTRLLALITAQKCSATYSATYLWIASYLELQKVILCLKVARKLGKSDLTQMLKDAHPGILRCELITMRKNVAQYADGARREQKQAYKNQLNVFLLPALAAIVRQYAPVCKCVCNFAQISTRTKKTLVGCDFFKGSDEAHLSCSCCSIQCSTNACERILCFQCTKKCHKCNLALCVWCSFGCEEICERISCAQCCENCAECNKMLCGPCMQACEECSNVTCFSWRCSSSCYACRKVVCRRCHTKKDVCEKCTREEMISSGCIYGAECPRHGPLQKPKAHAGVYTVTLCKTCNAGTLGAMMTRSKKRRLVHQTVQHATQK